MTTSSPVAGLTTRPATGTNWQADGLCREVDTDLFFPGPGEPRNDAIRICGSCIVRENCLEWALKHGERGIWGGTTTSERQQILRDRQETPAPVIDPFKDSRNQSIRRLTDEGHSAAEIALRLGCTKRTVTRVRVAEAA